MPGTDDLIPVTFKAELTARALMRRHGLSDWEFKWSNALKQAGLCTYPYKGKPGVISLSRPLTELWGETEMRDTILHEIAHALAGHDAGHGPAWKAVCRKIGANPERNYEYDDDRPEPVMRYLGTCPNGHTRGSQRLPKQRYSCHVCAPGRFNPRYLMTWTENPAYGRKR